METIIVMAYSMLAWEGTLLGTNISPPKGMFEDDFFSQGGICDRSLEYYHTVGSLEKQIAG